LSQADEGGARRPSRTHPVFNSRGKLADGTFCSPRSDRSPVSPIPAPEARRDCAVTPRRGEIRVKTLLMRRRTSLRRAYLVL